MKTVGIIPARYASTRLPGKPLAMICGKTMVQRVYEQCLKANLAEVLVATDDERIMNAVLQFGGKAVMTAAKHQNGTERIAEAISAVEADVVVNIQGDEPFIQPEQINLLLSPFAHENVEIVTLAKKCSDKDLFNRASVVKVVLNRFNDALYFSRSAIPFHQHNQDFNFLKHIGIYAFKKEVLLKVAHLPPSNLEQLESLEQLRWLENGFKIKVMLTDLESMAVDTPDDLATANLVAANAAG